MPWCALIEVHVHDRLNMLNTSLCVAAFQSTACSFLLAFSKDPFLLFSMAHGDFEAKVVSSSSFFFFFLMAALETEGHWWCDCPVFRQQEQSFSLARCPLTVCHVFLAPVLDRAAHTSSITQRSWWPRQPGFTRVWWEGTALDQADSSWIQTPAFSIFITATAQDSANKTVKYHYTNVASMTLFSSLIKCIEFLAIPLLRGT